MTRPAGERSLSVGTMTLAEIRRAGQNRLTDVGIPDAALEARLIVEHFTATNRTDAIVRSGQIVSEATVRLITQALARRISGEPVHRILGHREFYGLRLALSAETLEPRPDTETLVDALLPFVKDTAAREGSCRILDLGTGTGAIALALLAGVETATATGADISAGALTTARRNADNLGLGPRFTAIESDWFENISGRFHAIAANPPYIPTNELVTLQSEVRNFDPAQALDGGADGLDAYRVIAKNADAYLEADGVVAVEIGHAQKSDVAALFLGAGYRLTEAKRDLSGHDRVLVFDRG